MKRCIIETRTFSKTIDDLIAKKKLLLEDFNAFKNFLCENSEWGDLITGTGGIRKTRLKSSTKGKSGGFRICYLDIQESEELFLILIYPKNEKENLTTYEKQVLKEIANEIKKR